MTFHPRVLIALIAIAVLAYAALHGAWQGRGSAPGASTPPAQEMQTHEAGYWKNFVKPDAATLQARLTPLQYDVTQKSGTERAFNNAYWHNEEAGIYVDIVSGEPLFSSTDKYDSGTGWPSFTKPLDQAAITLHDDYLLGIKRTEVRSKLADSHLGHLFDDGPPPLGTRYCMNSAALRFIPKDSLVVEGYGQYMRLFQ